MNRSAPTKSDLIKLAQLKQHILQRVRMCHGEAKRIQAMDENHRL
jgi:hypothetical protein